MVDPIRMGKASVGTRRYDVSLEQAGIFDVDFKIWDGEPNKSATLGFGSIGLAAPADMLSNLPELWVGEATFEGRSWSVEGTPAELRLFDKPF